MKKAIIITALAFSLVAALLPAASAWPNSAWRGLGSVNGCKSAAAHGEAYGSPYAMTKIQSNNCATASVCLKTTSGYDLCVNQSGLNNGSYVVHWGPSGQLTKSSWHQTYANGGGSAQRWGGHR